jgi:hypothetical protein
MPRETAGMLKQSGPMDRTLTDRFQHRLRRPPLLKRFFMFGPARLHSFIRNSMSHCRKHDVVTFGFGMLLQNRVAPTRHHTG